MKILNNKICNLIYSNSILVLLLVYFYILCVDFRFLTGDEGYFAYASKNILLNKMPYKDFFFPQAFLYPYFLSAWQYLIGESWQTLRLFSAFIASLVGYLIYDIIRLKRNVLYALLGTAIYITCDLTIAYFTIIKNYSLSVFFILLSLRLYESKLKNKYLFIGFLLSIAVQIRSYLIVSLLAFAIVIFTKENRKFLKRNFVLLLLGFFIAFIPTLYALFNYFDAYIFNNITYHSLRNRAGLITGFHQKINSFCSLFRGVKNTGDISLQFILLCSLLFVKKIDLKSIYFYLALILFLVSFLPTPVYTQYFSICVPFLIIYFCTNDKNLLSAHYYNFLVNLILSIYLINFFVEIRRYTVTGINVSGIYQRKVPSLWRPKNLDEQIKNVASKLYLGENKKNIKVFSSWPGYLIGIKATSIKGLENHFARNIAHKLTKRELKKYRIYYSENDLTELISNKFFKYIILGYRDKKHNWQKAAKKSGYKLSNYKIVKLMY